MVAWSVDRIHDQPRQPRRWGGLKQLDQGPGPSPGAPESVPLTSISRVYAAASVLLDAWPAAVFSYVIACARLFDSFREVSTLRYLSSITTIATCESPKLTIFGVAALLSPLARTLALRCVAHALLAPRSTRSKSGPARKAGRASRIVISGAPGGSPPPLPTRGLRAEPTKLHLDPLPSRYAPSPVCRSR